MLVVAAACAVAAPAPVRADPAGDLKQELAALKETVERLDGDLAVAAQRTVALNEAAEAYRHEVEANAAAGQKLKEASDAAAARKHQLESEHSAVAELCRKKATSDQDYAAAVAHCKQAGEAYEQHAAAFRETYAKLVAGRTEYETARQRLKSRQDELAHQRQDNEARRAALEHERKEAADRYSELREHIIAQSKRH